MKSRQLFYLCITLLLCLSSTAVFAKKHALLIGVGKYPVKPLAGPAYDVAAMKEVLVKNWDFDVENVNVLVNNDGTRKNILAAIDRLYEQTSKGDEVFIYLSGHGTSASDSNWSAPLPTTTGAFIPVDIKNVKTIEDVMKQLIIGRRDLRPMLSKLDQGGRHVFIAIDACYSGNTVRGAFKKSKLPTRALSLSDILPKRSFGDVFETEERTGSDWEASNESEANSYPYNNVYYLSAAGEHEPAQDIPPEMIKEYPTFDGNPHGAFTNTLLRVLNKEINSDLDGNGIVTYAELKRTVRRYMRRGGFDHTPQGLPSLAEDSSGLADRIIFEGKPVPVTLTARKLKNKGIRLKEQKFRILLDKRLSYLSNDLGKLASVELVSEKPDMEMIRNGKNVKLVSSSGDLITELKRPAKGELVQYVKHQAWVYQLVNRPEYQDFSLDLELFHQGKGSTVMEGQTVGFSIRSAANSHILLVDIDPMGQITVLYPFSEEELQPVSANQTLVLENVSRVRPPYGRDYVQVFAFEELPPELQQLRAQSFSIGSPLLSTFEKLINTKKIRTASTNMELITSGAN